MKKPPIDTPFLHPLLTADPFYCILQFLAASDLMDAAPVNSYWNTQSNQLSLWRPITAATGLESDEVADHKIIAQLAELAPIFFDECLQYDPNDPKCAKALVDVVNMVAENWACAPVEVIRFIIAINQAITQSTYPFSNAAELMVFVPALGVLRTHFDMTFSQVAGVIVDVYNQGRVFPLGVMCNLGDFSEFKKLVALCDDHFGVAFELVSDRMSVHHSAFGQDNPLYDLQKAIGYLSDCLSDHKSADYQDVCQKHLEIQQRQAALKPFGSTAFNDELIRVGIENIAPHFLSDDIVELVKCHAKIFQCKTVEIMTLLSMLSAMVAQEQISAELSIKDALSLLPFYRNILNKHDATPDMIYSDLHACLNEFGPFVLQLVGDLDDYFVFNSVHHKVKGGIVQTLQLVSLTLVKHCSAGGRDDPKADLVDALAYLDKEMCSSADMLELLKRDLTGPGKA